MTLAKKLASAAPFAHLLGLGAKAKRAEDDDEDQKARRAEDGDGEPDDKKQSRADSDTDDVDADETDESAEDEQDEEDKKDSKKSKKARHADSDDQDEETDADDEDEENDDKSAKAARLAERARCKAIFESSSAGVRPDVAAHLAFNTSMSSKAAIAMLDAVAAGGTTKPRGLADRMAKVKNTNVGADGGSAPGANTPEAVAAQIIAAGKKRRGES